MSLKDLLQPFPWHLYSRKLIQKIESPYCVGHFTFEDAQERQMRYVEGREGAIEEGNFVVLYWLVDPTDGMIVDAKFQAFGQSALLAAAEAACELLISKNYDQARRFKGDLIDRHLRDHPDIEAFPEETKTHIELVVGAIEEACSKCLDLPLPTSYVSPVPREQFESPEGGIANWQELSKSEKLSLIEQLLDTEVRPYIELDAGGIKIVDLLNENELHIAYEGSCTSCYSSIGSTLSSIQQILQAKISSSLNVVPNLDNLKFTPD